MSFSPSGYVVDIAKVKRTYGSKKPALVDAVVEKHAELVEENAKWFATAIADEGAPRLGEALREIVDGKCTKKKHGFQYIYALELVCHHFGTPLFGADFINCEFLEALRPVLPKGSPVRKLLSPRNASDRTPALVPIPRQKDAVPGMGVFDRDECKTILATLKANELEEDRTYGEFTGADLQDGFDELKNWFQRAVTARRGLMMFWY